MSRIAVEIVCIPKNVTYLWYARNLVLIEDLSDILQVDVWHGFPRITTDFTTPHLTAALPSAEYGRLKPYFTEAQFNPIETFTWNRKAYLSFSVTNVDKNKPGREVGRIELTHLGVVSAEEALMMLGYDPKQLVEHPIKHRNAERSDASDDVRAWRFYRWVDFAKRCLKRWQGTMRCLPKIWFRQSRQRR